MPPSKTGRKPAAKRPSDKPQKRTIRPKSEWTSARISATPDLKIKTGPKRSTEDSARAERPKRTGVKSSFGPRKFGDKKFGDKKFGDKKFGDKKFGDKKFGDKKFGDKKFGDKKFGDKKFGDRKPGARSFGSKPARFGAKPRTAGARVTRKSSEPIALKKKGATTTTEIPVASASKVAAPARASQDADSVRLNKFIASAGVASRRKADELIEQGAVAVNGKTVTELGVKVRPHADRITVNGETISIPSRLLYLLLNKPKDTITTTSDEKERTTVLDYVKTSERVYPVGRLDRNTTGVLLLTNDGELTNLLTHPRHEIIREYHVTLDKGLAIEDAKRIADGGIDIGDGDVTGAAGVSLNPRERNDVLLTLREGKNREVRRLFETLGYEVEKLDRTSFAGLSHQGMKRGDVRPLTNSEVHALKRLAGLEE